MYMQRGISGLYSIFCNLRAPGVLHSRDTLCLAVRITLESYLLRSRSRMLFDPSPTVYTPFVPRVLALWHSAIPTWQGGAHQPWDQISRLGLAFAIDRPKWTSVRCHIYSDYMR